VSARLHQHQAAHDVRRGGQQAKQKNGCHRVVGTIHQGRGLGLQRPKSEDQRPMPEICVRLLYAVTRLAIDT
jgi:hypothetical protein